MAASDTRADRADPFPRTELVALVRRLPAYARLAWRLGRDRRLTPARRAAVLAAAAYLVSPVDLVPGIIPVAGQLDDAAVGLVGLRLALRGLPPAEREAELAAAGISSDDLDADLRTVRVSAAWLARRGLRLGARGLRAAARAGWSGARSLAGVIR